MKNKKWIILLVSGVLVFLVVWKFYLYEIKKNKKQSSKEHNPEQILSDFEIWELTEKEKDILSYGYSEEMLARDTYAYLYELYWEKVFNNTSASEQKHMDAVKALLNRYNLEVPTWYGDLQSTFEELKAKWEKSLKDAIEVGIQIEILDIKDIEDAIKNTDNDDFKVVFTNIGWASFNHLRWFLKTLSKNWLETDIDYSEFLSEDDLNMKWPLKYKLAERLEKDWIELPDIVSSEALKKEKWHEWGHWKWNNH